MQKVFTVAKIIFPGGEKVFFFPKKTSSWPKKHFVIAINDFLTTEKVFLRPEKIFAGLKKPPSTTETMFTV